jgi:glycosyltransferase
MIQTYSNFEVIIVDGASTDETLLKIQQFNDPRIKVISEKDDGLYYALNKGISMATGDVVGFIHSDDFFPDVNVLENLYKSLQSEQVDGVYANLKYVSQSDSNKVVRDWKSKPFKSENLKYGWMPPHPTLFLKRDIYNTLGGFNTNFRIAADYDFILRLFSSNKFQIKYLNIYTTHMRVGGASNKSLKSIFKKSSEDYKVISQYSLLGFFTLVFKNLRKIPQAFSA